MRSLVTGGAGFIGSHLVDRLLELGHEVVVIDNESSTSHEKLYWNEKAENYKSEICDFGDTRSLYDGVDYVFHLAADNSSMESINNPMKTGFVNTFGTNVVLQCAREARVKRVVFSSSYSIYGNNVVPSVENQIDNCLTPYALSKLNAEKMCKLYSDIFKTDTVTLRYFSVYGERQPFRGQYSPIMDRLSKQKQSGKPLTIIGDGEQRKDFIHVSDVVEANILAAEVKLAKEYIGDIFNIGSGKNYSVNEIAKMYNHEIISTPQNTITLKETLANIDKAKNILGWEPRVNLEEWLGKEND